MKDDIGVAPENYEVDTPLHIEEVSPIEAVECRMDIEKLIGRLPDELVELARRRSRGWLDISVDNSLLDRYGA